MTTAYVSQGSTERTDPVMIGMDVGSTTVKAVVVDPQTKQILWSDYQRHQTKQAEFVLEFVNAILEAFPKVPQSGMRMFITGSGASPLVPHRWAASSARVSLQRRALRPGQVPVARQDLRRAAAASRPAWSYWAW